MRKTLAVLFLATGWVACASTRPSPEAMDVLVVRRPVLQAKVEGCSWLGRERFETTAGLSETSAETTTRDVLWRAAIGQMARGTARRDGNVLVVTKLSHRNSSLGPDNGGSAGAPRRIVLEGMSFRCESEAILRLREDPDRVVLMIP